MRIDYASRMFNQAIEEGRIEGPNPFARLPKFHQNRREFVLSKADEAIFLESCPPWLRWMVEDNLFLGLRAGEIRALQRADFRRNEGPWGYVALNVTETKGERLKASRGRTSGARVCRIALTPEAGQRMRLRLPSLKHPYFYSDQLGDPVGKNTLERAIRSAWERAEAKIAASRGKTLAEIRAEVKSKGGFSFHSIRHTAATRDAEAGLTALELMQKYRWSDLKMAQRYVHESDEWSERAAQKRAEAGI